MKPFLAAGDVLINPALLAFALVETDSEGPRVHLGFSGAGGAMRELRLGGLEARSVIRWLRSHAEFLDAGPAPLRAPEPHRPVLADRPPAPPLVPTPTPGRSRQGGFACCP